MHPTLAEGALSPKQRRQLGWLLLAWVLFICYGSWVPLNFHPRDPAQAWAALWQWSISHAAQGQRLDTAVNVLLTVPLAFGLALLWAGPGSRVPSVARAAIVLLVFALSLLVEWGQGFLPGRSESLGDVLAQTVGTLLGLLLHRLFGRRAQARFAKLGGALDARSRVAQALHVYLALMLLFAVMPLDLTLDVGELYRKWREGRVIFVPFGALHGSLAESAYETFTDVLLWVPVGMLWRLDAPARRTLSIAGRAALLALAIELVQFLVASRVSDITDVLLSAAGAWVGAALAHSTWRTGAVDRSRLQRACGVGLLGWMVAVIWIYGWPFDVRWPARGWAAFADAFVRVPFITYFQRNEFGALNEILRKLLVFLPGGVLLRVVQSPSVAAPSRWPLALLLLWACLLEAGQVLLGDRVADLTDALLASLGGLLGWRLAGWVLGASRSAWPPMTATVVQAHDETPTAAPSSPAEVGGARARGTEWMRHALQVVALAVLLWLVARAPGVPYNLSKLMPPGWPGAVAAVGLALAAWWMATLPVAAVALASHRQLLALPVWLVAHGLLAFTALRLMVPLPMLHKVVGSPVLAWPWMAEDLARYLALHMALVLPLCGGAAVVQVMQRPDALARLLYLALLSALLAWPLHWAVVERAATDNLVELMRDGGGFGVSSLLACAVLALGAGAGALASLTVARRGRRALLTLLALSMVVTPAALLAGLEPVVVKYDKLFSALQFILSSGRDAYASDSELVLRYLAAYLAMTGMMAWLQAPMWRRVAGVALFSRHDG
jgi:glycopeptide antibiotics resistance protein